MAKTQFGKSINKIKSDNGDEFTFISMIDFYAQQRTILESSCPHTPQQNGVGVERKHRHLLKTTRTLEI